MEIRKPSYKEYKDGELDRTVKENKELKKSASIYRDFGIPKNAVEKLRSEMWFPNIDITTKNIKNEVDKVEGVRVLKYTNEDYSKENLIIFFHGGGYFGGSTDTIQNYCRYLSEKTNTTVISVDYSLAPEFPFPKSLEEGYSILNYYSKKYKNIYLGGDSAGGGLACSVLIKDIEENTNIVKGLIMYYPVLLIELEDNKREDFIWDIKEYNIDESKEDSNFIKSEALGLKYAMKFIKENYVGNNEDGSNYYISQINLPDEILKKFPKTLIFTVEYDYLRLEAEYFYNRLKSLSVDAKGIRYAGQTHAFIDKIGHNEQVLDSVNVIKNYFKI